MFVLVRPAFWIMALAVLVLARPLAAQSGEVRVSPPNEAVAERLRGEALVLGADETASAGDIIATARGDYERLIAALYDEGYFGARVSIRVAGREASTLSAFRPPPATGPVIIDVDLGPRFTYGRAEIAPLAPDASQVEGFAPGEPASTGAIRAAARGAVEDWRGASHAKARITGQEIVARHGPGELDVVLRISPGPALTFGDLVIPSDTPVRAERVRKIAGLPTGAPFTPEAVETARARLVSTGAFSSVVAREAQTPGPANTLDIALELEAAKPRRLGFGAEIDSTDGLSLEAFWLHRNYFGGAERLRFDASVSGIAGSSGGVDYALGMLLRVPGFRRADDTLEFSAALERLDEPNFEERLFEVGVRRARQVSETLTVGAQIGFRFSESTDSFGTREFSHVILSADAVRDLRDDPLNPREGVYGALELKPFIGVGDSQSGIRATGDFRAYRALGARSVIAGRALFGSVMGADLVDIPPDFLFYSGGGGSVRGQAFQSLGVPNGSSTTGGRSFGGLSLELRRDITETLSVVGFVDYGYVAEGASFERGRDHAGAGIGVRYNTALGPLRVDLGVPLGDPSDGTTRYGLYIGLGQSF
ncbi:MAG: BamA/TamA family outer membrane protein [Pseudomonadota bacterium]